MSVIQELPIPKGYEAKDVAEVFTAYLLASGSFVNGDGKQGPFVLEDGRWQLDPSNDYWLRVSDDDDRFVKLSCRYPNQGEVIEAMVNLFRLRFLR